MVPLLLLAVYPPRGKELHVASSAEDAHLITRIKALSPTVSLEDAERVTYCAVTTGRELARKWRVPGVASVLPGIQNFLIHLGKREGGYCFQYSTELLRRLDALKLQTLEFHWAESEANGLGENNAIVVTARGQPFEQGILLDSWRSQPHVTWTQVSRDPDYRWSENRSYAAFVLRRANNVVLEKLIN